MKPSDPFEILERGVFAALETYSNVHRGSGYPSMITTRMYEASRKIVLDHLGLSPRRYMVIFTSPAGVGLLTSQIGKEHYSTVSSNELNLSLGISALAVKKRAISRKTQFRSGGGTAKLISREWVIWAKGPARFEAGTPAVINIITFARALLMQRKYGNHLFGLSVNDRGVAKGLFGVDEFREVQGKELLERLRETRIGKNLMVPTVNGTVRSIHLDNSASTPTFLPAWDAFRRSLSLSESMRGKIAEEVSRICLDYLGASGSSYEVVFTSNATEAINVVAESLIREGSGEWQQVIVGSLLEHSSNDLPWRKIPDLTFIRLSVNGHGIFDLDELTQHLREYNQEGKHGRKRVRMVALSGASNVLGVCNDLAAISSIVHQYGAELLVDGAQLVPHRKVEMGASGIDYLAFSAHKVYAPFGTGVLVVRKGLLNFSGHQMERIRSSGEENTAGIAALGKVLSILDRIGMPLIENEEQKLTERALEQLSRIKGLKIYGIQEKESPDFERKLGVIAFNMERVLSFRVGKELAFRDGIGVRVGCHCAHITVKHILQVSQGLERFQHLIQKLLPALQFPGVVRMSLGLANSDEDVDRLMEGLTRISSAGGKKNRSLKLGSLETFYRIQSERVFGQL